jgi:hypothetical protein
MSLLSGQCETLPNSTAGTFYQYQPYTGFSAVNQTPLNPNANLTNLPTDVAEFDFGTVSSGCTRPTSTPVRETKTAYHNFGTTPQFGYPSILDRPQSVQTYGNGTLLSETDYYYDGSTSLTGTTTSGVPPTTVTPTPYGHDETNYGAGSTVPRGNPTKVVKQCFVGGSSCVNSVTTYTYDTTG